MKRFFASLLTCAFLLGLLPTAALAADDVPYLDRHWDESTKQVITEDKTVSPPTAVAAGTTNWSNRWYVVNSNVTISGRVTVSGDVHLILADGYTLTASSGISVEDTSSLTIYGQEHETGKLIAQSYPYDNAAIGGTFYRPETNHTCGSITINGGQVEATGANNAVGIGSALSHSGGNITINGGKVTAKGGKWAAGIGSSPDNHTIKNITSITINGGTVIATGSDTGAGIGGGEGKNGSDNCITINGGNITATGGEKGGAGIGGGAGSARDGTAGAGGTITITGGTVNAIGGGNGAGIGGGGSAVSGAAGAGGTITITGGTVNATGGGSGAGIGGGANKDGSVGSSGSFSTGTNGAAFITASAISDIGDITGWSGVIFQRDSGQVYGSQTIQTDAEIPSGTVLTIPENTALTIESGVTLTNNGTITVENGGTFINNGILKGNKVTPTVTVPTGLTATYGQTLADVSLLGGWMWDTPRTSVGNVGDNAFSATFTPTDTANYKTVTQTLTVTVSTAPRTIAVTGQANGPTQITLSDARITPSGTGDTVSYGINTTNTAPDTWRTDKVFSGLTAGTTYYFFAKVETNGNYAAAVSEGVPITTPAKAVSSISIANQPTNLSYTSGQTLDLSGLSVTVNYDDDTNETVEWASGKLTVRPAQGTALTVTGHNEQTVTISYGGATAETNTLTVTQGTQAALSITGAPATVYTGDSFTLTLSGGSGTGAVTWEVVSGPATVDASGKVTVTGTGEIQIKAVKAADTDYTQAEATITLDAAARPSGGSSTPPTYKPNVTPPSEGGGVPTTVPSNPKQGDTVTVTPKPDDGYKVDKITVTDRNGKPVEATAKPDGTYTFQQPSGTVTIDVTYVPLSDIWNNPFADIDEGDWYYEAVRFVQERGLMNGYSDGRFGPNDDLSRAQLAQILFNKEGGPVVNFLMNFSDVSGEAWYTEAIRWAASQGIVGGYGDGTFGPNAPITREQLAVMLWRYSGSPAATGQELHFNDEDAISGFALEAMRWAVENGIVGGYGNGQLGPQGQATHAQVAQMLKNFIQDQESNP